MFQNIHMPQKLRICSRWFQSKQAYALDGSRANRLMSPWARKTVFLVSLSRCLPSPQASVFYYYCLYGAMLVSRFLRVHKRPKRMYAKVMGQKIVL